MQIAFDDTLFTGNEMIDTQHKELIARVNKLAEQCGGASEMNVAVRTLDFLMDYTDFHFSAEEKLQEEYQYPRLEEHKKLHAQFVKSVDELREMLEEEEGPSEAFSAAVERNIVDWLVNHIQICDKDVAQYVRDHSAK